MLYSIVSHIELKNMEGNCETEPKLYSPYLRGFRFNYRIPPPPPSPKTYPFILILQGWLLGTRDW